jgi:uncharacterized protein (TIGR00288 family)
MTKTERERSLAVFIDLENLAMGFQNQRKIKFEVQKVLERLVEKGKLIVKKAYADWSRYPSYTAPFHESAIELIEIPKRSQTGKNSADIRLVVDALDLCYTKSHVDTFVIIRGDSDFSPLVSKLRENAKRVIGVGVKNSTSDLLVANCDEFIFYDDLAREQQRAQAKREARTDGKRTTEEGKPKDGEARKAEAVALVAETFEALVDERGESGKMWASVLKSAIKRRRPDFNEQHSGFRSFGNLLEEAQARGLLEVARDEKSGTFVSRAQPAAGGEPTVAAAQPDAGGDDTAAAKPAHASGSREVAPAAEPGSGSAKKGRGKSRRGGKPSPAAAVQEAAVAMLGTAAGQLADSAPPDADADIGPMTNEIAEATEPAVPASSKTGTRAKTARAKAGGTRAKSGKGKSATDSAAAAEGAIGTAAEATPEPAPAAPPADTAPAPASEPKAPAAKRARQSPARPRRKRADTTPSS